MTYPRGHFSSEQGAVPSVGTIISGVDASRLRPRVFVSSVMTGFERFRQAARMGIGEAGGEPVLIEDFPSMDPSPRNACLDAIDSCDLFIVIVGERGGFTAPSGLLVVEEEHDNARRRKLPIAAFLRHGVARDADAERLARHLSDYVDGHLRCSFDSEGHLRRAVREALTPLINGLKMQPQDVSAIQTELARAGLDRQDPSTRVVLGSEREGEVLDPLELGSRAFERAMCEIGHSEQVDLFDYGNSIQVSRGAETLVIEEREHRGTITRAEIRASGVLIVDVLLTSRHSPDDMTGAWTSGVAVMHEQVREAVSRSVTFCAAVYDRIDPYKRHQRFHVGVALHHLGCRRLFRERPTGGIPMSIFNGDGPVFAYSSPRLLSRADLSRPIEEVERAVEMLSRRAEGLR